MTNFRARSPARSRRPSVAPRFEPTESAAPQALDQPQNAYLNSHSAFTDHVMPVLGGGIFLSALPYLSAQIALCTLWEGADRRSLNLVGLARRVASWKGFEVFMKNEGDGFIFPTMIWLSFFIPALCIHEAFYARAHGLVWWRVLAFNVLRIGPMYKNFALAYTLAHKEFHTFGGVFVNRLNSMGVRFAFNWIAGPFFGILPGTFTHSHQYNHHKYNNGPCDVYSTGGYPRDSLWNFMRYIYVWFGYASNVSSILHFVREGRYSWAVQTVAATAYYCAVVAAVAAISPEWACVSLLWAFIEGNILLAMVNWVWHAFIDPNDPDNAFTTSTTIVDGQEFIFSEEYHVV